MFEFVQNLHASETRLPEDSDRFVVLHKRDTLLSFVSGIGELPRRDEIKMYLPEEMEIFYLGRLSGEACFAVEISALPEELPETLKTVQIRQFLFEYPDSFQMALCRARGLLAWRSTHRYCGKCRAELTASESDSGLICPVCRSVYYPQIAPAVIVAVTRNDGREVLLAHNRNFAGNMYSLIAGFVEAGESVEAALHREVWEECSVRVKNLRYITSQVWPFPNSLMLAFQAEYDSGTATPDGAELSDLGWYSAENHPELPNPGSVARAVIDRIFNNR